MKLPSLIYGTSSLGNLYEALDPAIKSEIIQACISGQDFPLFDSAGKYGAGLALEELGKNLARLQINKDQVLISNKLGWYRVPLEDGQEPSFEKGVWKGIQHDAIQKISYEGILECFYQGNELLQGYVPQLVSVHDPDEYLLAATDQSDREQRFKRILEAYQALSELKEKGEVSSIGVGSKDWRVIQQISQLVKLDWVMIANSLTVHSHPKELVDFIQTLHARGITVINSAVFNGGFLVGSDYYNYQLVDQQTTSGKELYAWRTSFYEICEQYEVAPAVACVYFGLHIPGVQSIALNTSKPSHVLRNRNMVYQAVPSSFWEALSKKQLISYLPQE